jgi:hypothetical protein
LKAWCTRGIVATAIVVGGCLQASAAGAARPVIYVVKPGTISHLPTEDTAVGLYVAGAGGTISRESAIASLRRGKVENALLGGTPSGEPLVDLSFRPPPSAGPRRAVVSVELPPPGRHSNTKRYWVAFRGGGYRGILTSDATRIRGLVPIADIAPTVVALREGRSPAIRSEPDAQAISDLRSLDERLREMHRDRGWVEAAVVLTILALVAVAPAAAVIAGAAAIGASLLLSCFGATRLWVVLVAMVALTVAFSLVGSMRRRLIPVTVVLFLFAYLVVLALSPETNSLAIPGARPDGGGRFYGIGNQLETLMLAPLIAGVTVAGLPWLVPIGALALITVGWSEAGADGGGLVVFTVALAMLALRLRPEAVTWRRVAVAAGAVVAVAGIFVGLDAALGGSSHVTNAAGDGPWSLLGDFGHRLHLSWVSATRATGPILLFLGCLAALVWIGTRRPRRASVDAMLVAVAVSLVVNDTPVDVIALGVLGCLALLRWEAVDSRPHASRSPDCRLRARAPHVRRLRQ